MIAYQHILLATDLSANAQQIAQQASEIAADANAQLSIIHVVEHSPLAYGGEFSVPIDTNLQRTFEQHAGAGLLKLAKSLKVPEDRLYLSTGAVKFEVVKLVNKINADLIIVGSHGHHGIEVLLGSRANAILHSAPCDVLAIRVKD